MTTLSSTPMSLLRDPLPPQLDLVPVSRHPTRLSDAALRIAAALRVPECPPIGLKLAGPLTSVIVVTYDGLAFNKLCLTALLANTPPLPFEVVVVDNASGDGTADYLHEVARVCPNVRVIFNRRNLGFSPAVNQGFAAARGDAVVLLNNDTIVPRGWLTPLLAHLDDPSVGAVGPVTNRIGNEAEIDVDYRFYGEFERFAATHARDRRGQSFDIPMLAMFCFATRRETYARVGPLDEQFDVGMFEDDDYARRIHDAGLRTVCARGAFVHHFGQASFGRLVGDGRYQQLFEANRARYERKWLQTWRPHRRVPGARYLAMVERIRATAASVVPLGSVVAVANKSDADLLDLPGLHAQPFPAEPDYPADCAAAAARVRTAQEQGAHYLLLPATSLWWLERYPELRDRLGEPDRVVHRDDDCVIFDVRTFDGDAGAPARRTP